MDIPKVARAGLAKILQRATDLVRPAAAEQRRGATEKRAVNQAVRAAAAAVTAGQMRRGVGVTASADAPKETEGAGLSNYIGPEMLRDSGQQALLNRRSTRRERFATHAGYGPIGWHTYRSLSMDRIAYLHDQVDRHGIMLEKDDTDRYVLRKDPHATAADRQRRSKVFKSPLLIKPRDRSDAARIVANFIRAAFDNFDAVNLTSDMLAANLGGTSLQELVYRDPRPFPVVVGKGRTATMIAETLDQTFPMFNRYLKFNIATDRPWIDMGGNRTVDPFVDPDTGEKSYKYLQHTAFGDGHARQRGYAFALHYLHAFEQLGWEAWITVLETAGRVNPFLQIKAAGFTDEADREDALDALENYGTGKPSVFHERWGTLGTTQIPAGADGGGIHAAIIGAIHTQKLILIQGETLSVEIGGSGSYGQGGVHENQQENVQWIDAKRAAETLRTLARYLIEINRDELARIAGVSPAEVIELLPRISWFLDRTIDPVQRLGMFKVAMIDMRLPVDPEQIYDEFHFVPPQDSDDSPPRLQAVDPDAGKSADEDTERADEGESTPESLPGD